MHGLDGRRIRPRNQILLSGNKIRRQPVWIANKSKKPSHQFQNIMKIKPNRITEVRHLLAKADHIGEDHAHDGVDRRGFLKCMAWAGTGMLWTVSGGVLGSRILGH